MRKNFIAALIAVALLALCLPFASGCNVEVTYRLCEEDGSKYYTVMATGFTYSLKGELVIPETYGEGEEQAPVKKIEEEAFRGSSIVSVVIPATVTEIGKAAFADCAQLKTVTFSEGSEIKTIPQGCFGYSSLLSEIALPDSVEAIGPLAFIECGELSSVQLPASLQIIGYKAFEACAALTQISFPEGLTTIGAMAFYQSGLKEVVIPDSVRDIEESDGEQTTLVRGIGVGAFHTCVDLEKAVVGAGVTCISSGAFGYCVALKEIWLPAGLQTVEGAYYSGDQFYCGHAFHSDGALTDVYFAGTQEAWDAVSVDATSLTENGAFFSNEALTQATVHTGAVYSKAEA